MTSPLGTSDKHQRRKASLAACGQRRVNWYIDTPLQSQSERSKRRRQWVGLHEKCRGEIPVRLRPQPSDFA